MRDSFETSKTTAVSSLLYLYQQAVINSEYRPLSLELTVVSEDVVIDNIEVFRKNGLNSPLIKKVFATIVPQCITLICYFSPFH